jgi:hypothetical protein
VIEAFPRQVSVRPGGTLELHVSTDAPRFRVEFHRCGARLEAAGTSGWREGAAAPHHLPHQDWTRENEDLEGGRLPAWPRHPFAVPRHWRPGVYVAVLREPGGDGRATVDARNGRALFVVRGGDSGLLYKLPLLTYHAYNQVSAAHYDPATGSGGWCLYSDFMGVPADPPVVSVRRPGGGTGGTPFDLFRPDPFDATPRQTFAHWDAPAIAWLEARGYRPDFCTDLDLHREGRALLDGHRLLLSFGHDEYWSPAMREAVEGFLRAGGNAAFFGGNTAWWRVAFEDGIAFCRAGHWHEARPENAMTGVSFRNGGERPPEAPGSPVGFAVQDAGHWVYAGTGLRDGDVFGDRPDQHLVGYECDGAAFDRARRGPVRPTGEDGTPADFRILGVGDVAASGWGSGNRAATLGVHAPRGRAFTASTTDWARVLGAGSPVVERITRNVVDRLGARA